MEEIIKAKQEIKEEDQHDEMDELPSTSDSQLIKRESIDPANECSICRCEINDEASLDGCIHRFCFECISQWLFKGTGPFCPMCKAAVSSISHSPNGKPEIVGIDKFRAVQAEQPAEDPNLVTEKRIILTKIRNCRRMLRIIEEKQELRLKRKTPNDRRLEELQAMKQNVVSQLNGLQMLKDDILNGSLKEFIISKPEFRRLIYEENVKADELFESYPLTAKKIAKDPGRFKLLFRTFMAKEVKAIPASVEHQPQIGNGKWQFNVLADVMDIDSAELSDRIYEVLSNHNGIETQADLVVDSCGHKISNADARFLISQLKSFAKSQLSYLVWCRNMKYSLSMGRIDNDEVRVYTVSDNNDNSSDQGEGDPYIRQLQRHRRNQRSNHYISPFDRTSRYPTRGQNQQYPFLESSDDDDNHLYRHESLRLNNRPFQSHLPTLSQFSNLLNPSNGGVTSMWDQIINGPSILARPTSSGTGNGNGSSQPPISPGNRGADNEISVIDLTDDDVRPRTPNSSTNKRYFPKNETIVLDDTPISNNGRSSRPSRNRYTDAPKELVDDIDEFLAKHNIPDRNAFGKSKYTILENAVKKARNLHYEKAARSRGSATSSSSSGNSRNNLSTDRMEFSNGTTSGFQRGTDENSSSEKNRKRRRTPEFEEANESPKRQDNH